MNIILSGGGTAGHVNPALAIAEEIYHQDKSSKILFIGRCGGKENLLITKAGFKLKTIDIEGLKRKITTDNLRVLSKATKARKTAENIIRDFKPDLVLGTGGYVCWPVLSSAQKLGIPNVIHESNTAPGLVTRFLAKGCNLVLLGNESAKARIRTKAKTKVVGTPLRSDFCKVTRSEARKYLNLHDDDFFILSFGGSIGAEKLNEAVVDVMKHYSSRKTDVVHIHGAGERFYKNYENLRFSLENSRCEIKPYISDMSLMMHAADVVISRCGAMTLSEISAVGVDAILIPSPNVTGNHQYKNAKHLESCHMATVIEEKNLNSTEIIKLLKKLKSDKNEGKYKAKNKGNISVKNSSKSIVKELNLLISAK